MEVSLDPFYANNVHIVTIIQIIVNQKHLLMRSFYLLQNLIIVQPFYQDSQSIIQLLDVRPQCYVEIYGKRKFFIIVTPDSIQQLGKRGPQVNHVDQLVDLIYFLQLALFLAGILSFLVSSLQIPQVRFQAYCYDLFLHVIFWHHFESIQNLSAVVHFYGIIYEQLVDQNHNLEDYLCFCFRFDHSNQRPILRFLFHHFYELLHGFLYPPLAFYVLLKSL